MKINLSSITQFVHGILYSYIDESSVCVDATVGNGNDTIFLVNQCSKGHIYGFDIQLKAINKTLIKLKQIDKTSKVTLIHDSHDKITNYINTLLDAAMFNLGYLPNSDHDITTHENTTITALKQTIKLLKNRGIISIVAYSSHEGGKTEQLAVESFLKELPEKQYKTSTYQMLNNNKSSPVVYFLIKK